MTTAAPPGVRTVFVLALAIAALSPACLARAAEDGHPADTADATDAEHTRAREWQLEAMPYAWLPGNFGTATVKGNTVHIAVTPSDMYQLLEDGNAFAGSGYFALGWGRLSVFDDSFGGYAEEAVDERIPTPLCCSISVRATDKIKFVINDAAIGWELERWSLPGRTRPLTLGVYAGARSMWFYNKLNAKLGVVGGVQKAANTSDSFAWSDPLIGVRWSAPVLEPVSIDFRADIGGFGASSNLIWGIAANVKVWLPWHPLELHPYAALGYRVVDFDRSNADGDITLQFRGPMAGAGFVF
jgi:hypothetical protein